MLCFPLVAAPAVVVGLTLAAAGAALGSAEADEVGAATKEQLVYWELVPVSFPTEIKEQVRLP